MHDIGWFLLIDQRSKTSCYHVCPSYCQRFQPSCHVKALLLIVFQASDNTSAQGGWCLLSWLYDVMMADRRASSSKLEYACVCIPISAVSGTIITPIQNMFYCLPSTPPLHIARSFPDKEIPPRLTYIRTGDAPHFALPEGYPRLFLASTDSSDVI